MRFAVPLVFAAALTAGSPISAAAQSSIGTSDVQRLQDNIYDASRAISQMRSRDASLASQLHSELDDAADEAVYLKVKLRKNESIGRNEYADVRDRVENIRNRARGDSSGGYTPPAGSANDDRPVSTAGSPGSYTNDSRYPNDSRASYP